MIFFLVNIHIVKFRNDFSISQFETLAISKENISKLIFNEITYKLFKFDSIRSTEEINHGFYLNFKLLKYFSFHVKAIKRMS